MKKVDLVAFRTDRQLIVQLAGTKRGAAADLMRRLLADEAARRGLVVVAEPQPQKAA